MISQYLVLSWLIIQLTVILCKERRVQTSPTKGSMWILWHALHSRGIVREGCKKSKWKFKMAFAIRRPTPPLPPLMEKISRHFYPTFFSFAIESYIYETDFTLKNITFKSSYCQQFSHVQSHLNYYLYIIWNPN